MSEKPTVEQLLRRWVQLRKQGLKPEIEDLCRDCPELAGPLRERIERRRRRAQARHHGEGPAEPVAAPDQTTAATPVIQISGYTILRELGHGGQGVIFKALQHSTGRHVAVKILTETRQLSDIERTRFDREAQVLAALEHPHIVFILDRGHTAAGSAYFAMEYIEGRPLDRWLQEYRRDHPPADIPSNPGELLRLFMRIADAVNVAHLRGIIHRDLKPSNILVDGAGNPHILDFGLARLGLPAEVYSEQHRVVTMTGQFIGTLPWVSPEQAEGLTSKVDTRTDVYSLGVLLYEMLTAEFPYEVVGNMRDVLDNILRARPRPPSTVIEARLAKQARKRRRWRRSPRNPITPELEAIVLKALSKRPEDRYRNAGELARDIGSYLSGRPTLAAELRPRLSRRRIAWAASAGAVLVLIVIGAVVWMSGLPRQSNTPQAPPASHVIPPESSATSFLPDPSLRAAVRDALGLKDRSPTPEDLHKLAKLDAFGRGIRDLTGLEHGTNLTSLMLNNNQISDLSALGNLQKLTYLWVMKNKIEDVSPLAGLSSLQVLVASNNQIRDIRPLAGLKNLQELSVDVNPIGGRISPVAGLVKLRLLHVTGNEIRDLSALGGLTSLEDLWLSGNKITDLTPLLSHARLRVLRLDGNPLGPMAVDTQVPRIRANNPTIDLSLDAPDRATAWRIPDPNLRAPIKETLGLKDRDPTPADMIELTSLDASARGIRDLTGLERATNLTSLDLTGNRIDSLAPLAGLARLQELRLAGNQIGDVSPLAGLRNLTRLILGTMAAGGNRVQDIRPLSQLTQLLDLSLHANNVTDIAPLSGLRRLQYLSLSRNSIDDLSPLSGLDQLRQLWCHVTRVHDLTSLRSLTNLEMLDLGTNQIRDISALAHMQKLTHLWLVKNEIGDVSPLAGLSSLQMLIASNNQIRDISPLSGLSNLKELSIDANPIGGRISPLAGLVELTHLHVSGNGIRDISALEELTSLEDLWLSGNEISDLTPLLNHARLRVLRLDGNPLSKMAVDKQIPAIRANNPAIDILLAVSESPP